MPHNLFNQSFDNIRGIVYFFLRSHTRLSRHFRPSRWTSMTTKTHWSLWKATLLSLRKESIFLKLVLLIRVPPRCWMWQLRLIAATACRKLGCLHLLWGTWPPKNLWRRTIGIGPLLVQSLICIRFNSNKFFVIVLNLFTNK